MTRTISKWAWSFLALASRGWATSAHAGLVTYTNLVSWSDAVSQVTTITIPDPAPLEFIYIGTGDASVAYSGVTFSTSAAQSNGNFFNVGVGYTGYPAVLQSSEQTVGAANILIVFPDVVSAFALDYDTFSGSNVTFTPSNGDSFTQGSPGDGYNLQGFAGATDAPFTSVTLTSYDPICMNINNISYGIASVREPGSLTLLGIGGATLLGIRWRCRKPKTD